MSLYQALLPGLTNVTQRARYFSFYPWVLDRYVRSASRVGNKAAWRTRIRRLDFAYASACVAYEGSLGQSRDASIVGGDRARQLFGGVTPSAVVDLAAPADVDDKGRVLDGSYFKNPEGGFGQYYRVPLQELGLLQAHHEPAWPSVKLTEYAGQPLCRALDAEIPELDRLEELALDGSASSTDLSAIGARLHPDAIEADGHEARTLSDLLFLTEPELCQGQDLIVITSGATRCC